MFITILPLSCTRRCIETVERFQVKKSHYLSPYSISIWFLLSGKVATARMWSHKQQPMRSTCWWRSGVVQRNQEPLRQRWNWASTSKGKQYLKCHKMLILPLSTSWQSLFIKESCLEKRSLKSNLAKLLFRGRRLENVIRDQHSQLVKIFKLVKW